MFLESTKGKDVRDANLEELHILFQPFQVQANDFYVQLNQICYMEDISPFDKEGTLSFPSFLLELEIINERFFKIKKEVEHI